MNIVDQIEIFHRVCRNHSTSEPATRTQLHFLVKAVIPLFENRKQRIRCISFLIGREIQSFNDLNHDEALLLLNEQWHYNRYAFIAYAIEQIKSSTNLEASELKVKEQL